MRSGAANPPLAFWKNLTVVIFFKSFIQNECLADVRDGSEIIEKTEDFRGKLKIIRTIDRMQSVWARSQVHPAS